MPQVLSFEDVLKAGVAGAGGKGAALADMQQAGFRVPRFFVITPEAFSGDALSAEALAQTKAMLQGIGASHFAVRSSARSEDGKSDSHAGQFLSLLEIAPDDVPAAAAKVLASGLLHSVAEYRAARGHVTVERPAIVVQEMVVASSAGVAFAADPVTGRRDRVVISAILGLGDRLVSGHEDGDAWILTATRHDVLARPATATAITERQARDVAALCEKVTAQRGHPQDIEWAYGHDGKVLYLLQSRPITTNLLPPATSEAKLFAFDNSNIVESYPGIVAPLTFSFAVQAYARVYKTFLRMIGVATPVIEAHQAELSNMLSRIDGRMYYNLGNWYRLLSLLPFFSRNRQHMETMMGVSSPLPDEAMQGAAAPTGTWAVVRMVVRLLWQAVRLKSTYAGFISRMQQSVPPRAEANRLAGLSLSELAAEYRRLEAALLDRWDAPIVNDFLCMMAFGGTRKMMERWAGQAGLAIHNDIMIGQGDIISAVPAQLIREAGDIVRGDESLLNVLKSENTVTIFAAGALGEKLKAYVARFGDRRIGELKLEQPTLDDDATPLFRAVHAAATVRREAVIKSDPAIALDQTFSGKPLRKWFASKALAYAKARVRDRENLRFERTRIFGHARRVFLAMGQSLAASGLIEKPDHVFQLTVEEILSVCEGSIVSSNLRGFISLRLAEADDHAMRADPPERLLMRGTIPERQWISTGAAIAQTAASDHERSGTACGGGVVTGLARVVRDPAEEQVKPGEILVARHTDPGWISHFANAAAVVAERGSVLSHSAIVSRELGIPCVVAVADACAWISTGDQLEIDGSRGIVRKVNG